MYPKEVETFFLKHLFSENYLTVLTLNQAQRKSVFSFPAYFEFTLFFASKFYSSTLD